MRLLWILPLLLFTQYLQKCRENETLHLTIKVFQKSANKNGFKNVFSRHHHFGHNFTYNIFIFGRAQRSSLAPDDNVDTVHI